MPQAVYILFGAVFTAAVATALGKLLLRGLRLRFYRQEEHLLAFVCGAPLLSGIVFALCVAGLARKGVFLWVGIAILAFAWWSGAHRPVGEQFPALGLFWKRLFAAVYAVYTVLYFFNAMAPEISPDGATYHLGLVLRYLLHHGFYRITNQMYANLSEGVEMLFLYAFAFGRHSAAAMVHCAFLLTLPLLMLSYARRFGLAAAGVCGALFFFVSPVAGIDGASAYIDVAVASIAFTLFYLLQIWDAERTRGLLVPIGLLAGFAYAAKYTAAVMIPYALAFIAWKCWRKRQAVLTPLLVVGACALIPMLPWMVKNWIWLQNPFSPFLNAWFPNPYVTVTFEREYRDYFLLNGLKSYGELPLAVTVHGQLSGLVGPLFLLAPVALLSLRWRTGRQLLLGALPMGVAYFGNTGARFLIPVLPFLSIAMAMAFLRVRYLAPALVLANAVVCWVSVVPRYCGPVAWRFTKIPYREALRIKPEEPFLQSKIFNYPITRLIESVVKPEEVVFALSPVAEAYTRREIRVGYESAANHRLQRILWTPLVPDYVASWLLRFRFPSQALRRVRVVQTALGQPDNWTVAEFRVYGDGHELPRAPQWRLRAHPNPWDAQLAFDNSMLTFWSSAETIRPGMFMELDFGRPEVIDTVRLECPHDQYKIRLRLEGMDPQGRWKTLAGAPETAEAPQALGLRRAATAELKHDGIDYIVMFDSDFQADDFRTKQEAWGITKVAEAGDGRLYRIR